MNRNAGTVSKPMTLIVVEDGASLPTDLARADGGFCELMVVAQDRVSPSDLMLRVTRAVVSCERPGRRLARAMLVVGGRNDAAANAARCLIARSLAAHLASTSKGELEIVSGKTCEASRRHELLALAGVLTAEAPPHLNVSVRFETPEREEGLPSGVYPTRGLERELAGRTAE